MPSTTAQSTLDRLHPCIAELEYPEPTPRLQLVEDRRRVAFASQVEPDAAVGEGARRLMHSLSLPESGDKLRKSQWDKLE
jgi:hypothetical protein